MAEDDDPHYVGWGHLEEHPESILTTKEVTGWWKEFDLPTRMEIRTPYLGERANKPHEGWFAIYETIFLLGLDFLIPRLASAVLAYY